MDTNRRDFLKTASLGAASITVGNPLSFLGLPKKQKPLEPGTQAYKHRIAFGAWVNDMRNDPLPLENWPAPQFDDETVSSIIRALDLQSACGYNILDAAGYDSLAHGWDLDISSSLDKQRIARIKKVIRAAHDRGMKMQYIFGTYSWGFNKIIAANPEIAALTAPGGPKSTVAMCDANPLSFEWVKKILDYVMTEFDFDAVHLESADQGFCNCPLCAGKDGSTAYNCRIVAKTAQYIRSRWPDKFLTAITIGWIPQTQRFDEKDKQYIRELSKHIDCLFDQGHHGTLIDKSQRQDFIKTLHCDYGTSGGIWLYPSVRWDRQSYFVPYTQKQGNAIKEQYNQGVRGCMHYQGPLANPATEVNIVCGGRILSDVTRDPSDCLAEVIADLYKPKSTSAHKTLTDIYKRGETIYFSQWQDERFKKSWGTDPPGEFYMDQLFGDSPGPAGYIIYDQYLDAKGRLEYKKGLISIMRDLEPIRHDFKDNGRIDSLRRSIILSLTMVNTIMACKGEPAA